MSNAALTQAIQTLDFDLAGDYGPCDETLTIASLAVGMLAMAALSWQAAIVTLGSF